MLNKIYTIIITSILISCSSTNNVNEKKCNSILKNDYQNIIEDKFKSIVNNETIYLNEVKYKCVHSSFYIQKGMYDRFGKWDKEIFPKGINRPILLWNNIKLFPNDSTEFTVAANGLESIGTIYTSVLVFDNNNVDLLAENSNYKAKLIDYFSEMIKSNNSNKKDFYDLYWKTFDPKRWEELKKYNNK